MTTGKGKDRDVGRAPNAADRANNLAGAARFEGLCFTCTFPGRCRCQVIVHDHALNCVGRDMVPSSLSQHELDRCWAQFHAVVPLLHEEQPKTWAEVMALGRGRVKTEADVRARLKQAHGPADAYGGAKTVVDALKAWRRMPANAGAVVRASDRVVFTDEDGNTWQADVRWLSGPRVMTRQGFIEPHGRNCADCGAAKRCCHCGRLDIPALGFGQRCTNGRCLDCCDRHCQHQSREGAQ